MIRTFQISARSPFPPIPYFFDKLVQTQPAKSRIVVSIKPATPTKAAVRS